MSDPKNLCGGTFGAVYDFYIEREPLARLVGRTVWGIDVSAMYASMAAITQLPDGATVIDVPCGGGVAFRALRAEQQVRYIAVDLSEEMLDRARRRAASRRLSQIETVAADMCALPLADETADLCLSYSGLHALPDPEAAVREMARCLKPAGQLVGSMFLLDGSRRQRFLISRGQQRGEFGLCGTNADLKRWLQNAGFAEATIDTDSGFAVFHARKDHHG
jgi:ubiquinone/menaquinone biosynthesis C-methylase UbiE